MLKYIKTYKDVIPEHICNEFVKTVDSSLDVFKSSQIDTGTTDNEYRNSESIFLPKPELPELDEAYSIVKSLMYNVCLEQYIKDINSPSTFPNSFNISHETPSLIKYKPNEGFYKKHIDNFSFESSMRLLSAIIYLNDVNAGGETYFPELEFECRPETGKVLIFPSGLSYPHQAHTPTSNAKYCIVWWFTYRQGKADDIFHITNEHISPYHDKK